MTRIVLAGAGELGQRHLQALCRLPGPIHVDVVDPSEEALRRAEQIISETPAVQITQHQRPGSLDAPADIAIVATNSRERRETLEALIGKGVRRFLLEKVLFPKLADYEDVSALLLQSKSVAWVNCARRTYPHADMLRDIFAGKPFCYRVEGGEWGLACNLVHHLDEVAFLSGRDDFEFNADELDKEVMPAKRADYFEVTGTMRAKLPGGVKVSAVAKRGEPIERTVKIESENAAALIDQSAETLTLTLNGETKTLPYPIPFQSVITAEHVSRILEGKAPDLPDFTTASNIHKAMISTLLDHFRMAWSRPELDECPIT